VEGQEASPLRILDNMTSNLETSKLGLEYDTKVPEDEMVITQHPNISKSRQRRSFLEASAKPLPKQNDQVLRNLPGNRTISLNCLDPITNKCVEAQFTVYNCKPGNTPIQVSLNFGLDLKKVSRLFSEKQNVFLFQTRTKVVRGGDEEMKTIKVITKDPYTLVYEQIITEAPVFVITISAFTGFLMLMILSHILYRVSPTIIFYLIRRFLTISSLIISVWLLQTYQKRGVEDTGQREHEI
jgi:hypothetical protein